MAKKFSFHGRDKNDEYGFYCCLVCGHFKVNESQGRLTCARCGESIPDKNDDTQVAQLSELCPCCAKIFESAGTFVNRFGERVEGVHICQNCDAVIGTLPKNLAIKVVRNAWSPVDVPHPTYYGLTLTKPDGSHECIHGWFDQKTGLVTQTG